MNRWVYIPDEDEYAEVITQMAHGAVVRYKSGGFEVQILLSDEDYEELFTYEGGD